MIYADNAATTKVCAEALSEYFEVSKSCYANASSNHGAGWKSKKELQNARQRIANIIGGDTNDIYFTSCGSESNNIMIQTIVSAGEKISKKHLIVSAVEHKSILNVINNLDSSWSVTYVKPNKITGIDVKEIENSIREDTVAICVMLANNEVGTIYPYNEIGSLCRKYNLIFGTDAVQGVGHIGINVLESCISIMTFSAHKFHGPKGVAGIYIKHGITPAPVIIGGYQENGVSAGTVNVPAVCAMAKALESTRNDSKVLSTLREFLINEMLKIDGVELTGGYKRLPGHASFIIDGVSGEKLSLLLSNDDIYISSVSACYSGGAEGSYVLSALGYSQKQSTECIRISLGRDNSIEDIERILEKIKIYINLLRNENKSEDQ